MAPSLEDELDSDGLIGVPDLELAVGAGAGDCPFSEFGFPFAALEGVGVGHLGGQAEPGLADRGVAQFHRQDLHTLVIRFPQHDCPDVIR